MKKHKSISIYLLTILLSFDMLCGNSISASAAQTPTVIAFAQEKPEEITLYEKEPLEEVLKKLPASLEVSTEAGEFIDLPVTWECQGDYENTNYFYYQFVPIWDTSHYEAKEPLEIPYVWVSLVSNNHLSRAVTTSSYEAEIYNFLINSMGCNTATACGILANIERESGFNPAASVIDTNGLPSYGICQWNGSRFDSLKSYCSQNGYSYTSVTGQLNYLKYELNGSEAYAWSKMQGIENTADGAYTAGYNWAKYFERCASVYHSVSAQRAKDVYWPEYGDSSGQTTENLYISGYNTPGNLVLGGSFSISGFIHSNSPLTKVTVGCYDSNGALKIGASATPRTTSYSITNLDNSLKFGTLPVGTYTYRITATNATETKILVRSSFSVLGSSETSYKVNYNANGGSGAPSAQTKAPDAALILSSKIPTRSGYTFLGWSPNSEATSASYQPGDIYSKNASVTLYAIWEKTPPTPFIDVEESAFYCEPVIWALENEITTGLTPQIFGPAVGCTRGQIVTFLYRAMNGSVSENAVSPFTDTAENAYYYDAVLWAVENDITTGVTPTRFEPNRVCSRGEIVTFLCRAVNGAPSENAQNKFTDAAEGAFYYDAMLWAVENDITTGITPTLFKPKADCTRGQIVTFLYRTFAQ